MTDIIRIELGGKDENSWNRVFDTLMGVVIKAVEQLAPPSDDANRNRAKQLSNEIGDLTKQFSSAKLDRPALDNEHTLADIQLKFEELKLVRANRELIEVETKLKRVKLDSERLRLWEQRLVLALKWLAFLQNHIVREADGSVTLVMTNQDMMSLLSEVRSII